MGGRSGRLSGAGGLNEPHYPPQSSLAVALGCKCPRCGEGKLFRGLLAVRSACDTCGLDFSKVDSGDGPAVFVIFLVGPVVVGLALWLELAFEPPLWLHVVLWFPLTLALSLALIRPLKAFLIAQQYRHKIVQGFG